MPDPTDRDNLETYSQFYRRTVANIDDVLILDRFFPSSMVYGKYFDRDVPLNDINTLSKNRDIFVFVIDRDEPFREDEFINQSQWQDIRNLYLSHAKANKWKTINNNSTLENCVTEILESLQF
jgi:thymidylate kinase